MASLFRARFISSSKVPFPIRGTCNYWLKDSVCIDVFVSAAQSKLVKSVARIAQKMAPRDSQGMVQYTQEQRKNIAERQRMHKTQLGNSYYLRVNVVQDDKHVIFNSLKSFEKKSPYIALVDLQSVLPDFDDKKVLENLPHLQHHAKVDIIEALDENFIWLYSHIAYLSTELPETSKGKELCFNMCYANNTDFQRKKRNECKSFADVANFYEQEYNIFSCWRFRGELDQAVIETVRDEPDRRKLASCLGYPEAWLYTRDSVGNILNRTKRIFATRKTADADRATLDALVSVYKAEERQIQLERIFTFMTERALGYLTK